MGITDELIKGEDEKVHGAIVRIPKTNSLVTRLINKLYPIECKNESHTLKLHCFKLKKNQNKRQRALNVD